MTGVNGMSVGIRPLLLVRKVEEGENLIEISRNCNFVYLSVKLHNV